MSNTTHSERQFPVKRTQPENFVTPKDMYIRSMPGYSIKECAEKFQIPASQLYTQSSEEGWQDLRAKYIQEIERNARQKGQQVAIESVTEMNARHISAWKRAAGYSLDKLSRETNNGANLDKVTYRDLNWLAMTLEKAQKGERLARGLSDTYNAADEDKPVDVAKVLVQELMERGTEEDKAAAKQLAISLAALQAELQPDNNPDDNP